MGVADPTGTVIDGRYTIGRFVGNGGMGAVYEARHADGRVAVKLLHPHLADDAVCMQRFLRESEAAASVVHTNVVHTLDMGIDRTSAPPRPYLVMEYVEGPSVAQGLAQNPFDLARAREITVEVLAGLAAVHAQGVVHRDLKPDNVLLAAPGGTPKIFDFGVAVFLEAERIPTPARAKLTPIGTAMGTPQYCSPEQLRGSGGRDPRVDVYAAGLLLYEMIAGVRPFEDTDLVELCRRIMNEPPPPLRAFRRGVPPDLEAAVRWALAKNPEERPQSAPAFARALRSIALNASPRE